jgi:CBS domain-containing protein
MAMGGHRPDFAVLDPDSRRLLGVVSWGDVARAAGNGHWYRRMLDIMQPVQHVPSVSLNTTLAEVHDRLTDATSRVAAVYEGPFFRGLISLDDVQRTLNFLSQGGSLMRRKAWMAS